MSSVAEKKSLDNLSPFQPRRYIPANAQLTHRDTVVALLQMLLDRPVQSTADLEQWLWHRSELESALDEAGSVLYVRMTCQTDNPRYAEDYKNFIESVIPAAEPLTDQLNHRYLDLRSRFILDNNRYQVYDRALRADVELFRDQNVPLQTDIQLMSQEYQALSGSMMVHFKGSEQTLSQMGRFLEEPDRALREEAWRLTAGRRLQEADRFDALFDRMLAARVKVATNAGFSSFTEYQFREYHRFDYSVKECQEYHRVVEQLVVPVWEKIVERRRQQMSLDALRPWDMAVDPLSRPPLRPFERVEDLISGCIKIFARIDQRFGRDFDLMAREGLLDLANRKGKAPGGYQSTLAEARKPFIFMNSVGQDYDVRTLLHEGGHAFHALACAQDPLLAYRHAPMEFCEVASMSMELLGDEHLDVFYGSEDLKRSRQSHLESVVQILVWVAAVDAFQHWIYAHPAHSRIERQEAWKSIHQRFGGKFLDWSGLEPMEGHLWHKQLHIFEVPFYYIEYGIAQLGALHIWLNARQDWQSAIRHYQDGLSLGGSRPLPELFRTAGLKFDFSAATIATLIGSVRKELAL